MKTDANPRVELIALGGTIASVPRADAAGVFPDLTAQDIINAVPGVSRLATIHAQTFAATPSVELDLHLLHQLAGLIQRLEAEGVAGFVITQGTDTIEETAYVLDLMHSGRSPVVVTGAMRNPSLPGPDGPANVFAAIACAACPDLRDAGVLVVMNDTIHAAAWVQKSDTSSVGAFTSPAPLGWLAEGKPSLYAKPRRQLSLSIPGGVTAPFVPILKPGIGEAPLLVEAALQHKAAGLVVELSGGGHARRDWAEALGKAARHM
jgi:L-asparaginase/Glu-tRNA(Gln) amidotransferase subunit D